MLCGILTDLDDTLFPQGEFLDQAWDRVVDVGGRLGLDRSLLRSALVRSARRGTDRGHVVDTAVAEAGGTPDTAVALVRTFTEFRPAPMPSYPGVEALLPQLAMRVPVVVLTDGNPAQQRAKLAAIGLADVVSGIVCTDEIGGRAYRKPHPAGFEAGLAMLGCTAEEVVMVGDRPDKDVAGACALGMRAILIRQGEHRQAPVNDPPWRCVSSIADALELLLELTREQLQPCTA